MSSVGRFLTRLFGTRKASPTRRSAMMLGFDLLEGRAVPSSTAVVPTDPSGTTAVPALQAEIDPDATDGATTGGAANPSETPTRMSFPMPFGRPPFGSDGQQPAMNRFPGAPAAGQNNPFPGFPDQLAGMDQFPIPTGGFPNLPVRFPSRPPMAPGPPVQIGSCLPSKGNSRTWDRSRSCPTAPRPRDRPSRRTRRKWTVEPLSIRASQCRPRSSPGRSRLLPNPPPRSLSRRSRRPTISRSKRCSPPAALDRMLPVDTASVG
jgi:hypothetical protein